MINPELLVRTVATRMIVCAHHLPRVTQPSGATGADLDDYPLEAP